jgi:hypothetical protein
MRPIVRIPVGDEATRQGQNTGPVGWKSPTRQRWRSNGFSLGGTEGSNPLSSSGESSANLIIALGVPLGWLFLLLPSNRHVAASGVARTAPPR